MQHQHQGLRRADMPLRHHMQALAIDFNELTFKRHVRLP